MPANFNCRAGHLLFFAALCLMGTKELCADTLYQTTEKAYLGSETWNDGSTRAVAGNHYVLEKLSDGTAVRLGLPSDVTSYTFDGDSLTIRSGCSFHFLNVAQGGSTFICNNLRMGDGAFIAGNGNNSKRTSLTVGLKDTSTKLNIEGSVEIRTGSGKNATIYSDITGSGVLKLCGWENGSAAYANYYLRGNNSGFKGRIDTTRAFQNDAEKSFNSENPPSQVDIAGRKNLGGTLSELDSEALVLADYVSFITGNNESIKLEKASNRGVAVVNGATISNAKNFEIETKLSLHGELRKNKTGKLILSGQATGFGPDGTWSKPESQNGYINNVLKIYEGGLVIGSTDVIRSVSVGFAAGTTFELRPDFGNEEFLRYGIRNNTMSEPFKLGSGLTSLPFSIAAAKGKPKSGVPFRMGLFTVHYTKCKQVDMIRQSVAAIQYPIRGFEGKLVEIVDAATGEVTFAIDYMPKGVHIVVR